MINQIRAHNEGVSSLTTSPSNALLCTTSGDHTAGVWDLNSWTRLRSFTHDDAVNSATFTDENVILTSSDDRTVRVWDMRQSEAVVQLKDFKDGVNKTLILDDGIVLSAVDDGLVHVHDLKTGCTIDRFWVATNTVNDLVIDPTNKGILITASEDCAVRTWKLLMNSSSSTEDRLIASFDEFENPVNHIRLQEGWLYAACSECVFATDYLLGQGTFGEQSKAYSCHTDYVRGIEFFPRNMFTVSDDTTLVEWNIDTCAPLRQVKVHDEMVMAMTLIVKSSSTAVLLTGCEGGIVRAWSLPFETESFAQP